MGKLPPPVPPIHSFLPTAFLTRPRAFGLLQHRAAGSRLAFGSAAEGGARIAPGGLFRSVTMQQQQQQVPLAEALAGGVAVQGAQLRGTARAVLAPTLSDQAMQIALAIGRPRPAPRPDALRSPETTRRRRARQQAAAGSGEAGAGAVGTEQLEQRLASALTLRQPARAGRGATRSSLLQQQGGGSGGSAAGARADNPIGLSSESQADDGGSRSDNAAGSPSQASVIADLFNGSRNPFSRQHTAWADAAIDPTVVAASREARTRVAGLRRPLTRVLMGRPLG